jgi:hypothetical protein
MGSYEEKVRRELLQWEKKLLKDAGFAEKWSRQMQQRIDRLIPEHIHQSLAKGMEVTVKSVLSGIDLLAFSEEKLRESSSKTLIEQDFAADRLISRYKKIAAAEGAGTGFGGIVLAAVDYPALLAIKLKFLSEMAQNFGFDLRELPERVFCLRVFLLAYSTDTTRQRTFQQIKNWNENPSLPVTNVSLEEFVSWREFYTEYKESIEFKKMLSFIPFVGALFNGWGNYSLLDDLGEIAKNSYRLRIISRSES